MVVSEKSDYFYSRHTGNNTGIRIRIDGSFTNGGTGTHTGGWWWLGTNDGYTSSQGQATWVAGLQRHDAAGLYAPRAPPNSMIGFNGKNVNIRPGPTRCPPRLSVQGIGQTQQNNPLISAHPNVVLAVFMDGHTAAITKNTPAPIVKRLATRDDGQQIGEF